MDVICDMTNEAYIPAVEYASDDLDDEPDEWTNKSLDVDLKRLEREKLEERQEEITEILKVSLEVRLLFSRRP